MSLKSETVRSGVWSVVRTWGSQGLGTLFFLILAYLLSPGDFGIVAFAGATIAIGEIVLDLGLSKALIQRTEVGTVLSSSAFWFLLLVGLGLMVLFWSLAPLIPLFFDHSGIVPVVRFMAVSFFLVNAGTVFRAVLERRLQFGRMALSTLSATTIAGLVGIWMAWSGFGFWSLVVREVLYDAVETIGYILFSDWTPDFIWSYSKLSELFSFGGGIISVRSAGFFRRQTDDFLIGTFLGATALGYYSVAYRIYLALSRLLMEAVNRVTFPSFSKIGEEIDQLRNAYMSALNVCCLFIFPVFLLVSLYSRPIISLLMDPRWLPSSILLALFSLAGALETLTMGSGQVVLSLGRSGLKSIMGWTNALLNVVAYAIGLNWGIVGVAVAYAISEFIFQLIPLVVLKRLIRLSYREYLKNIGPTVLLAFTSVGIAWGLDRLIVGKGAIVRLLVGGVLSLGFYILMNWLFRRPLFKESCSLIREGLSEVMSPIS